MLAAGGSGTPTVTKQAGLQLQGEIDIEVTAHAMAPLHEPGIRMKYLQRISRHGLTAIIGIGLAIGSAQASDDVSTSHDREWPVRCESRNGQTEYCSLSGRPRLSRQISRTECIEGDNWGAARGGVWVADGCRAEFVSDRRRGGGWPGRDWDDEKTIVNCSSKEHLRERCPVRIYDDVRLVRQLSVSPCVEGDSWGWNRRGIWVSKGCRAEFRVD